MTGKMERRMAMDCWGNSGCPDCFSTSHGASKKSRNVENMDIDFVDE